MFEAKAMQEFLSDVAYALNGGKRLFNRLLMLNGTEILNIHDIP